MCPDQKCNLDGKDETTGNLAKKLCKDHFHSYVFTAEDDGVCEEALRRHTGGTAHRVQYNCTVWRSDASDVQLEIQQVQSQEVYIDNSLQLQKSFSMGIAAASAKLALLMFHARSKVSC